MIVDLHSLLLSLQSSSEPIRKQWRDLFDFETSCPPVRSEYGEPDLVVEAELASTLPPSPSIPPSYIAVDPPLAVYPHPSGNIVLRLSNKAQIQLDKAGDNLSSRARILIREHTLGKAGFEDITTLALAPLLRRHGLFMIHAFTATLSGKAVMFVGPSGSGKTSCGLSLIGAGWQLLANDVALMQESDVPLALLSPGTVHISPATFSLLPGYQPLLAAYPQESGSWKAAIPRLEFLANDPVVLSAPIKAVFFPEIHHGHQHKLEKVPRSVGLVRLMESSMDQWDQETWKKHIGFLERLCNEVTFHTLYLGHDMTLLPAFLKNSLDLS